jgi:hypothetical protein
MLKKISIATSSLLLLPAFAFAQPRSNFGEIGGTVITFIGFLNNILVPLVFSIAFLIFIWGMVKFFIIGGASQEGRDQGKQLALWSVAGFVLIVSLWGLVNVTVAALNFGSERPNTVPSIPIPNAGSGNYGHF